MKRKSFAVLLMLALMPTGILAEGPTADKPPAPVEPTTTPLALESTDAAGLRAAIGKKVVVRGKVVRVNAWDGGITFINLAGGFAAVCFKKDLPNFPVPPEQMCANQTVAISGTLVEHKGRPQIELVTPDQIKIIPAEPAPPEPPLPPIKPKAPKPAPSGPVPAPE